MELEFAKWFLESISNYGFPTIACGVLYFDLRKEIRSLREAVEKKI